MTTDPRYPVGDEAPRRRPSEVRHTRVADGVLPHGLRAASKFVGRVSQLDIGDIRAAVQAWHDLMRTESEVWFAAERAAGDAVLLAGRAAEQEILLSHLGDSVLRGVWYRAGNGQGGVTPERLVGATEASAQYAASVAMLALLVRDRLSPHHFAVLYRPFAGLIPLEELGRE